jgi:hypothetical protein
MAPQRHGARALRRARLVCQRHAQRFPRIDWGFVPMERPHQQAHNQPHRHPEGRLRRRTMPTLIDGESGKRPRMRHPDLPPPPLAPALELVPLLYLGSLDRSGISMHSNPGSQT